MTIDDYERQMCATAGWQSTPATLAVMTMWGHLEGVDNPRGLLLDRGFNIWMTTWPDGPDTPRSKEDIGFGPGKWNNANPPLGVGIYANATAGITATIKTIRGDSRFAVIDRMFQTSTYIDGFLAAVATWIGDPGYSSSLDAFARLQYAAPVAHDVTVSEIVSALGGPDAIRTWNAKGNSLLLGFANVQEQAQETANKVATLEQPVSQIYADIGRILTQAGAATTAAGNARGTT